MTESTQHEPDQEMTVTVPTGWVVGFCTAGAIVGFGAAFLVGPVVDWLISLVGGAPGPLRLAARLPLAWAIPVLTLVGVVAGLWVARVWRNEVGVVTVSASGVTLERPGERRYVGRARIAGIFTDGTDLVLTDAATNELARSRTDRALTSGLQRAFETFGYPWLGESDPHESSYVTWVDGHDDVDPRVNTLLRTRQRALADKKLGAADDARDELRTLGVVVRDRGGAQQYRETPRE
ncbi:YqeB family protein [Salana multivorans]